MCYLGCVLSASSFIYEHCLLGGNGGVLLEWPLLHKKCAGCLLRTLRALVRSTTNYFTMHFFFARAVYKILTGFILCCRCRRHHRAPCACRTYLHKREMATGPLNILHDLAAAASLHSYYKEEP